jgi:hypothetical protein
LASVAAFGTAFRGAESAAWEPTDGGAPVGSSGIPVNEAGATFKMKTER